MNRAMETLPKCERKKLLLAEDRLRRSGQWGAWDVIAVPPGSVGSRGWAAEIRKVARNRVFAVTMRLDFSGALHLGVSSLSGSRPSWHEMQRIKDELAGEERTAVEVYPPKAEIVDQADMFHIWVLPGPLPFSLWREA